MEQIKTLIETYTYGLPIGVVAAVVLLLGLWLKKKILRLVGIALIAAAVAFYFLKVR